MSSLFPSPLWGDVRSHARVRALRACAKEQFDAADAETGTVRATRMREGAVLSASQSRSLVKV